MLSEDQIKALRTHLRIVGNKIPKELYSRKMDISAGEYMGLLINSQLSVINEILETIDKDKEEGMKHNIIKEFEKFRGKNGNRNL